MGDPSGVLNGGGQVALGCFCKKHSFDLFPRSDGKDVIVWCITDKWQLTRTGKKLHATLALR